MSNNEVDNREKLQEIASLEAIAVWEGDAEVHSGRADIVFRQEMTRIWFYRYTIIDKNNPPAFVQDLGRDVNTLNGYKVEGAPTLPEGFIYVLAPVRTGYLYMYNETQDEYAEYEILEGERLRNIRWREPSETSDRDDYHSDERLPKRENGQFEDYTGLPLYPGEVVWLAYSEVQWGVNYAVDVLNDAEKREKRMQRLDMMKYREEGWLPNTIVDTEQLCVVNNRYTPLFGRKDVEVQHLSSVSQNETEYREYIRHNMFYIINDPLGAANDLVDLLHQEYDKLDALTTAPMLGEDPDHLKRDAYGEFISPEKPDQQQYESLFGTALVLYHHLYNEASDEKDEKRLKGYRKRLNPLLIPILLGVKERRKVRWRIREIRDVLGTFLFSNYYQHVWHDYVHNSTERRLQGIIRITEDHYGPLSDLPEFHDQHMDLFNPADEEEKKAQRDEYQTYDKWRHLIQAAYFNIREDLTREDWEPDQPPYEGQFTPYFKPDEDLLDADWKFRTADDEFEPVSFRLYRQMGNVSSSDSVDITNSLWMAMADGLNLYGPFVKGKFWNSRLIDGLNALKLDRDNILELQKQEIGTLEREANKQIQNLKKSGKLTDKKRRRIRRVNARRHNSIQFVRKVTKLKLEPIQAGIKQHKVWAMCFINGRKRLDKWTNNPYFNGVSVGLNMINLGFALSEINKRGFYENIANISSASLELASTLLSLTRMRKLDLILTRMLFKNVTIRLSTRIGWAGCIVGAIASGIDSYNRFRANDVNAAICYAIASASAVAATTGMIAVAASAAWGGPVAWIALGVGILAVVLGVISTDNDFESFLSNSIFKKEVKLGITGGSTSFEVAYALVMNYELANKKVVLFDLETNLREFPIMQNWVHEFFSGKENNCFINSRLKMRHQRVSDFLGGSYNVWVLNDRFTFTTSYSVLQREQTSFESILLIHATGLTLTDESENTLYPDPLLVLKPDREQILFNPGTQRYEVTLGLSPIKDILKKIDRRWDNKLNEKAKYILIHRIVVPNKEEEDESEPVQSLPLQEEYYVHTLPLCELFANSSRIYPPDTRNVSYKLKRESIAYYERMLETNHVINWTSHRDYEDI